MSAGDTGAADTSLPARAGAVLTIDLAAVQANYRRLQERLAPQARCAAVVKADAYGLGAARVGPALARAGAETFFVAQLDEGIAVREALRCVAPEAEILVLNGTGAGPGADFRAHRLIPVLNSLGEIESWQSEAARAGHRLAAALHVDTGMNRLGMPQAELDVLAEDPRRLDGIGLRLTMSHLACAELSRHPMNAEQRAAYDAARGRLPAAPGSLANSSGIFLGPAYHYDLARPGVALYGGNPTPNQRNPMQQVVRLQGKILQAREIDAPQTVGYGATHRAAGPCRLATVAVGYADGYLRSLSNRGRAWVGGQSVPVVGRVSMDLITLDVSAVPPEASRPGALVDLIGPEVPVDDLAEAAGTIGYEILTALGGRYHRVYRNG